MNTHLTDPVGNPPRIAQRAKLRRDQAGEDACFGNGILQAPQPIVKRLGGDQGVCWFRV